MRRPETYTRLAADADGMDSADTTEIGAFAAAVASDSVTPSGGACAAVAAAMGAALCEMGSRHAPTDEDSAERGAALEAHRDRLLVLADADAAAVDALLDARRDGDPDAIAAAERGATEVPLDIAEEALVVLEAAADVLEDEPGPAGADVLTGAFLAHAAVRAAAAMVRTNLESIADADDAAGVETTVAEVTADAEAALARVTRRLPDG